MSTRIGQLTSLESLELGNNALSSTLPTELGRLIRLSYLHLDGNLFDGQIDPSVLGSLYNLRSLKLASNKFVGNFPTLSNHQNLLEINIAFNRFTGPLYPFMNNNVQGLRVIGAFANQFSGSLPYDLNNFRSLEQL